MRVGAIVHMYPPTHNAGAEWMLHTILNWLDRQGHDVSAWVSKHDRFDAFRGVNITGPRLESPKRYAERNDVILTHLDETQTARAASIESGTPLVHLVHNHRQLSYNGITPATAPLVIFNSRALCATVAWSGPQIIVRPPVPPADYMTPLGQDRPFCTLINLSAEKGAETFYKLAARCPERRFCGVLGAYGYQVKASYPNVEVRESTPRLRRVYAETRVLLMPSSYESWGRVGVEAGWSGIPTIYHPTPGLCESLGLAGLPADRREPDDWERILATLDHPDAYQAASERARRMALYHWAKSRDVELPALEQALLDLGG